jgi:hypothetical protein
LERKPVVDDQKARVTVRPSNGPGYPIRHLDHEFVVLPNHLDQGKGIYDESALTLVKVLRAGGIDAAYLHEPEQRIWQGHRSGLPVAELVIGIASNAAWAALVVLLRNGKGRANVKAQVLRIRTNGKRTDTKWLRVEGPSHDVADALERFEKNSGGE